MEPTQISAVSIARRLQDPLSEFVKIGPKHIGVGMYQHDISEQKLKKALNGVLEECVSFVGKILASTVLTVILLGSLSMLEMQFFRAITAANNRMSITFKPATLTSTLAI